MFKALLAYSPYHNVVDGTDYPAVLLTAGEIDTRVDAWHAKKMVARLQAATTSGDPSCCAWSPAATSQARSTRTSTRPPTSTHSSSTSWVSATRPTLLGNQGQEDGACRGRRPLLSTAGRAGLPKPEDTGTSPTRLG